MNTIIESMQLCHIRFYQKIAHKKVARVNAALGLLTLFKLLICLQVLHYLFCVCCGEEFVIF